MCNYRPCHLEKVIWLFIDHTSPSLLLLSATLLTSELLSSVASQENCIHFASQCHFFFSPPHSTAPEARRDVFLSSLFFLSSTDPWCCLLIFFLLLPLLLLSVTISQLFDFTCNCVHCFTSECNLKMEKWKSLPPTQGSNSFPFSL